MTPVVVVVVVVLQLQVRQHIPPPGLRSAYVLCEGGDLDTAAGMALPRPALSCPVLLCLTTRSICGIETAPISVRLTLRGETPPEATVRKDVFVSLALVAVDLPFLRDPGCSVLSVLEQSLFIKPGRTTTSSHSSMTHQQPITHRSRQLVVVSSSSENAGLLPRLGNSLLQRANVCCSFSSRAI